jgi:hypothetical protein
VASTWVIDGAHEIQPFADSSQPRQLLFYERSLSFVILEQDAKQTIGVEADHGPFFLNHRFCISS